MTLVLIAFIILLIIGMPVAFAIGISGALFFIQHPELPFTTVVQLPISATQNFLMLAVPLFIFAGNLMNSSGISERLVKLSLLLTGHMKGGLAQVSVVLSTLMGGVSGSATADAAMESRILGPDMEKQGYPKGYTAAVIAFTSLITATIPPGVNLILYGTVGNVSISRLFIAGFIAGLFMMILQMITVAITANVRKFKPHNTVKAPLKEILLSLKETIWAILFPVFLLVGIRFGIFTPSEVGAFACFYALFVGVFIYKELTWQTLWETLCMSVTDVGAIMFIIALSGIFGYGIPIEQIPQQMMGFITSITVNPILVMILIMIGLVVAGMFIDGPVIILLATPILLPIIKSIGIDPILFGIIMATVATFGSLTPPVGIAMYTVCSILKCPTKEYITESYPFIIAIAIELLILIVFSEEITKIIYLF